MELRKDYLLNRWTIISTARARRPDQFVRPSDFVPNTDTCVFCVGQEDKTPAELSRVVGEDGNWAMRTIPNKFPALSVERSVRTSKREVFEHAPAHGVHDIIIETPNHTEQLWDFSNEKLFQLLYVYRERVQTLLSIQDLRITYVHVMKNHGKKAGASLPHSHSQVFGMHHIPSRLQEELNAAGTKKDIFHTIIEAERFEKKRFIAETKHWVSFAPYAPRFNMEAWIVANTPIFSITDLSDEALNELAVHMRPILQGLKRLNAPYNYYVHYSPTNKRLRVHMEILPRLNTRAGFEVGSDDSIVTITPEHVANFYKG